MTKPFANLSKWLLLLTLWLILGCASISSFDQYAYVQATALKVDALNLMDLSTEDYSSHEKEAKEVLTKMLKAYEYEKHRPKNQITTQMWDMLMDTSKHLLGGFIKRWKEKGKLSKFSVDEEKKLIAFDFDQIAELESRKIKKGQPTQ